MKKYGFLLPLAMICLACACMLAAAPNREKSRYYLLQGMQREVESDLDAACELYRHAHALDPDNKLATYKYGMMTLLRGDSASTERGMGMMREYVEAYPADYQEALAYANLCARVSDNTESYRVLRRLYALFPDKTELLGILAEMAMHLDMPDTALAYLERQEMVEGASPFLTNCKMIAYMTAGDTAAVMRETDSMLRTYPGDPYYYLLRGSAMREFVSPDSALAYFKAADSVFPGNWDVKRALMMHYDAAGDTVAFENTLYEAMLAEDADLDDKIEVFTQYVAPLLTEDKGTAHADHMMEALKQQYPYEPTLRGIAAQYSAAKGDMDKAADQVTIAVDMASDNMEYRTLQVQYLVGAARYDEAVRAYEAVPADQSRTMPLLSLMAASAYQGAERYPEALAVTDSLLRELAGNENPDSLSTDELSARFNDKGLALFGDALGEKGNILFLMGRPHEGLKAYDLSLAIHPGNPMLLNNCAFFMAKAGLELDKAAEMSLRSVTEEPENPVYLDTYAYILFRQGKYDEALGYMEKALAKAEADKDISPEYYEHYGDILSKLGQPAKALEMWNKALRSDPTRDILRQKIKSRTYIDE